MSMNEKHTDIFGAILVGFIFCVILVLIVLGLTGCLELTIKDNRATFRYYEPAVNEDNTWIRDLAYTSAYYDIGQGTVKAWDEPARRPSGSTIVMKDVVFDELKPGTTVQFWATATDITGNTSKPSKKVQQVAE